MTSQATGENTKEGGFVIYEGTEAVTDANVETARRTRNQYVWVPVASEDFITEFVRQDFGMKYLLVNTIGSQDRHWEVILDLTTNMPLPEQDIAYVTNVTQEGGVTNTLDEVQAMYASVKEYQGFYIARYEAGIDVHRTSDDGVLEENVYSMMGKIPYNHIPWTKNNIMNEDINGAVQVARSIYPITSTKYGVVSTLTYGVQWDAILQWWLDTKVVSSVTNSVDYGNHSDHIISSAKDLNEGALVNSGTTYVSKDSATLVYPKNAGQKWALSTGALKVANVNNIYDMAGNMCELTMEANGICYRVHRGGYYNYSGNSDNYPVAQRYAYVPGSSQFFMGFRPSLYIKQ